MEALPSALAGSSSAPPREPRVRCRSRRWTGELLGFYVSFVRKLGDGQPLEAENLERALGEAVWNFESAVQENVTINGQLWEESDDLQNDMDIELLEDQLDELMVKVASKRKHYPRNMQKHVARTIKKQQELLRCYQAVVNTEELKAEPSQDSCMADLKLSTKTASSHIGESFKSLSSLVEKAEGFSKVLSLQPTLERCKLRQEIVSGSEVKKENKIDVKNLTAQVEVTPPQTAASNCVLLKRKGLSCSPQKLYPLQRRKTSLDT